MRDDDDLVTSLQEMHGELIDMDFDAARNRQEEVGDEPARGVSRASIKLGKSSRYPVAHRSSLWPLLPRDELGAFAVALDEPSP